MQYWATRISDNLHETPEGYLLALSVPIGRTGEMEYGIGETPIAPAGNGLVIISRDAEELFKPETIASFQGKPLTIGHPTEFVDADNWKELAKGVIQNVRRGTGKNKNDLVADILITDSFAISLVKSGMRQLSCGYEAEYEETGKGTGVQKNILGNHLALVDEGRAGDAYRINDEKGVIVMNKKVADALKAMFGKTVDQQVADAEKAEKSKKAKLQAAKDAKKKKTADKMPGYDELVAQCKDLLEKVQKMGQPNDEEVAEDQEEESADEEVNASLEQRLKNIEEGLAKLLKMEAEEQTGDEEEEEEVVADEDEEESESEDESSEEAEDEESEEAEDEEGPKLTGDEKSRVEILAPGMKATTKDFKAQALKKAWDSEEGQKAIRMLTGDKKPKFTDAAQNEMLFVAVPEMLKASRNSTFSKRKRKENTGDHIFSGANAMTPEMMNKKNEEFYNKKK